MCTVSQTNIPETTALLGFIVVGKTFVEAKSCSSLVSVTGTSTRTVLSRTVCCERNLHSFCVKEVMLTSWQVNTHSVLYQLCFYLFVFVHLFVSFHFILFVYFFITSISLLFVSICFLNFLVSFCLSLFYPSFNSSKLSAHSSVYITLYCKSAL
jgi:hypothetical protein